MSGTDEIRGRAEFHGARGAQAGDGNVQINRYETPGTPLAGRKRLIFLAVTVILAATVVAAAIVIAAMIPRADVVSGSNASGPRSSPLPSAATGSASASASASTPDPARASDVPTQAVRRTQLYQKGPFELNGNGCDGSNLYHFYYVLFWSDGPEYTPITSSPVSNGFGVTLFCSTDSSGSVFGPNIQSGGRVAILSSGEASFDACYREVVSHPLAESIPFDDLKQGGHICLLGGDSELALVTLQSVNKASYDVILTVTVWRVLGS